MIVDSTSTPYSVLVNVKKKCDHMNVEFDMTSKIFKVLSLNDYIFDMETPFINYTYFVECIRLNKIPQYVIIDNPFRSAQLTTIFSKEEEAINKKKNLQAKNKSILKIFTEEKRKFTKINPKYQLIYGKNEKKQKQNPEVNSDNINYLVNLLFMNFGGEDKINKPIPPKTSLNKNDSKIIKDKKEPPKPATSKSEIRPKRKKEPEFKPNFSYLNLNPNNSYYYNKRKKYFEKRERHKLLKKNTIATIKSNKTNSTVVSKSSVKLDQKMKMEKKVEQKVDKKVKKKVEKKVEQKVEQKVLPKPKQNKNTIIIPKILINEHKFNISKISRQFNIIFRSAYINQNLLGEQTESVKKYLIFKFELFCSNHPIGLSKQIRWTTFNKVQNPIFNKRIYFERTYENLPNFSSLLIEVKYVEYRSNEVQIVTKFWGNCRLFDHENRLKVGLIKVNLHSRQVKDDIYYCYSENPDEENSSKIYFEVENFANKIEYQLNMDKPKEKLDNDIKLFPGDLATMLGKIDKKNPFEDLNDKEKNFCWSNRFFISKMPHLIPRLLQSCNYKNPYINQELLKIFTNSSGLTIVQAIELLSGNYVNELIREFAVNILRNCHYTVINQYLLQLVQALKYEKNIDNPLGNFLLETAISHPLTVGHEFFWHLRAEMSNPDVQKKFGLYLEVFLLKINKVLFDIFKEENDLLKKLVVIAEKCKLNIPKEERKKNFKSDIEALNLELDNKEISLPLNFKYRIKGLIPEKCRIMKSKKLPLWLTFVNADEKGDDIVVMLKCGDDLRMDMVTLQLFKIMQELWYVNGLKVKMSLYKVLCTGDQQGMLEMVTNSETLANIHVQESSAFGQMFSKGPIKNWIEKNKEGVSTEDAVRNFMLSNVAYCLATFVLGIGDRHNDNIMLKKNGELFHIDFGHFLGNFKKKFGIKRERAPFVFTKQFQAVLGNEKSELYKEFKENLKKGYRILRKNQGTIVTLLRILLCTGIEELTENNLKFLIKSLAMKKEKDEEADQYIEKQLQVSIDCLMTKVNFLVHILANK